MNEAKKIELKGQIRLLDMLLNYKCNCKDTELIQYMKSLKYDYEYQLKEL